MKAYVLKDTTLTVKAGQLVDIDEREVPRLIAMGRVQLKEEPEKAVPAAKPETKKKTTKKG